MNKLVTHDCLSILENLELLAEVCHGKMNFKNNYSNELNNTFVISSFEKSEPDSGVSLDGQYVTTYDCGSSRIVIDKDTSYHSKKQNNFMFETMEGIQEDNYTKVATSYRSYDVRCPFSVENDFPHSKLYLLQKDTSSEKNDFSPILIESTKSPDGGIFMSRVFYSKEKAQSNSSPISEENDFPNSQLYRLHKDTSSQKNNFSPMLSESSESLEKDISMSRNLYSEEKEQSDSSPISVEYDFPNSQLYRLHKDTSSQKSDFSPMLSESSESLEDDISMSRNLYSEEKEQSDSSPISVENDFPNSQLYRVHKDTSSQKNDFSPMLRESSESLGDYISMSRNLYSEEKEQSDISVRLKEMLKCDVSMEQMHCSENSFLEEHLITAENQCQDLEESGYQVIDNNKAENNLETTICTRMEKDFIGDNQCSCLDDDVLLEIISEAFEFLQENEKNYSCIEDNISLSASMLQTEDKHSEPYCVKIIQNLQKIVSRLEEDLLIKEHETYQLKSYFETNAQELVKSCNFNSSKEKECNQFRKELEARCDKLLEDIKRDKNECKLHSENMKNIEYFLEQNCSFVNKHETQITNK